MHLTDEQLNEYLDHETTERVQIEGHLAACEECSARLASLRDLFAEIESLPELDLSPEFAVRLMSVPGQPAELPRPLTWTLILQAALAVIAIVIGAPFVMRFLSSYGLGLPAPSLAGVFMQLQGLWSAWLDTLVTLPVPTLPDIPAVDVSSIFAMFAVIGVSLLWLVGNGLLLRNRTK